VSNGEVAATRDPLSIPSAVKASIRILLVDDERTLRESCASVLQMDGYNVTLAGRGEEALDFVRNRRFDIILVDLYMSQVPGLEILRAAIPASRPASRPSVPVPGTTSRSRFRRPTSRC
jgi:CheY-like chemotaxis protein